jgi:hypothetical protein
MKIVSGSHLDHGLSEAHVKWILEQFGDRTEFFRMTVEMPTELPPILCELHGPMMGDDPVPEREVQYHVRGNRKGATRMCKRARRPTRLLTVIGGPGRVDPCILYTAFGGPAGAREVWDTSLETMEEIRESRQFWSTHALTWTA